MTDDWVRSMPRQVSGVRNSTNGSQYRAGSRVQLIDVSVLQILSTAIDPQNRRRKSGSQAVLGSAGIGR